MLGNGTPEQVHLTWGDDPATSVVVSWGSPGRALRPRVRIGQRVILAREQACPGEVTGKATWAYHARVSGLRPGANYAYAVTADNDANAGDPFTSTFRTAPAGPRAFRFTCSGDLAAPPGASGPGYPGGPAAEAGYTAGTVESLQPLFHLLNGGLCDASGGFPGFGRQSQLSAASRPWMPVPGSYGASGQAAYLGRYALPGDGEPQAAGRWYSFRVGTAVFACVDTGTLTDPVGPAGDEQTRWLERALAQARGDESVDWIVVSAHHPACCASAAGSYLPVRAQWLPLFDQYEVDLVLSGHGAGYERSFPCRGHDRLAGRAAGTGEVVETLRPHPASVADTGVIDTSRGTVHLVLGGFPAGPAVAGAIVPAARRPGTAWVRAGSGGAIEDATWSARRDPAMRYGIAVFDVDPGTPAGDQTLITVSYYRVADPSAPAAGQGSPPADDDFTEFDRFTLIRPRATRPHRLDGAAVARA
ncbi:MAG TPA: fibronectin type III domain-containing protein [Trebonia sp.]|nr:fibronectin type III domain-containing protein [Trebonia sp.]